MLVATNMMIWMCYSFLCPCYDWFFFLFLTFQLYHSYWCWAYHSWNTEWWTGKCFLVILFPIAVLPLVGNVDVPTGAVQICVVSLIVTSPGGVHCYLLCFGIIKGYLFPLISSFLLLFFFTWPATDFWVWKLLHLACPSPVFLSTWCFISL